MIAALFLSFSTVPGAAETPANIDPQHIFGAAATAFGEQAEFSAAVTEAESSKPLTRYAVLVSWDPASAASMRANIKEIDVLLPVWLHLAPNGMMALEAQDQANDIAAFLKQSRLSPAIMPIISNFDGSDWRGDWVETVLTDRAARTKLLDSLQEYARAQKFQGVTIDFQKFNAELMGEFDDFVSELAAHLHAAGMHVNVVIPVEDADWHVGLLAHISDALIVTTHDRFKLDGEPGPITPLSWFQANLNHRLSEAGPGKLVVGITNIGYDWRNGYGAETHNFSDVMLRARQAEATITVDPHSLNPTFTYRDIDDEPREVWYVDATTTFNQLKSVDLTALKGIALWRLGAEDPAVWSLLSNPIHLDPVPLAEIGPGYSIEYHGEGEVLRVAANGEPGRRQVIYDPVRGLITGQSILAYPVAHQVARWGGGDPHKIVLTFDDGPDPATTPRILDILKEYKVPGVFFVLGLQALRYPDLVRRIVDEGHEIGNHTFSHADLGRISDIQLHMELNSTQRIIESTTGRATLLFRPPYAEGVEPGSADELRTLFEVSKAGYFAMGNRIDGKDWWLATPDRIIDRVVDGVQTGEGNVVLLHDSGGNRDATVAALPQIIKALRADGYQFTSAANLIGRSRDELMPKAAFASRPYLAADAFGFAFVRHMETLVYFIFAVAILLTLARTLLIVLWALRKPKRDLPTMPDMSVSVIVPAYNEAKVVCQTVHSLLASDHAKLEILVVDDGSTDGTYDIVSREFAGEPRVKPIRKENGGKSSALNLGISLAESEIVVVIDADTIFKRDTISKLVAHFSDPRVGAVAGNAKVGNRINLVTRWQALEYIVAQNLDRRAFERLNCITVVPGAVGAWRRELAERLGGFHSDTLAEDADLTIRVIRAGYRVTYEDRAIALTEAPATVASFVKQRFRWTYGMMQVALKHFDSLSKSKMNTVGWVALPNILVFQLLLPCIAPIADLLFVGAILGKIFDMIVYPDLDSGAGLTRIFVFYALFFAVDLFVAVLAFLKERDEQWWMLILLVPQRFFHRQLLYYVVLRAIVVAIRGRAVSWYKVQRMATVRFHPTSPAGPGMHSRG